MLVMPANNTGWQAHCLARETGRFGHLFSPGAQRSPVPWFPYSLDNGAFTCWDPTDNSFDDVKWESILPKWEKLLFWAQYQNQKARWAIVPDVVGNSDLTLARWTEYAPKVQAANIPLALAVQDGMTVQDVRRLEIQPEVIAIGGSDKFKWGTVAQWCEAFPRVHLLRCCSPRKLYDLEAMGVESCDGTGWFMGDEKKLKGLERWAYSRALPVSSYPSDFTGKIRLSERRQSSFA